MTDRWLYVEQGWPEHAGPTPDVRALVVSRCGGFCEWPGCRDDAVDVHHRLGRKSGGRHGDMDGLVNSAANLVGACRPHHRYVTSAYGPRLVDAHQRGWVLTEDQDPRDTPILTRHRLEPVWFDLFGGWHPTTLPRPEEAP